MKQVWLIRMSTGSHGTFGVLLAPGLDTLHTGELPCKNNMSNVSCIPTGTYTVRRAKSPRFGWVYHVQNVPRRTNILVHSGNFCGDTSRDLRSDVLGCILLGTRKGELGGQNVVLASRVAVKRFRKHMGVKPFKLTILGGDL